MNARFEMFYNPILFLENTQRDNRQILVADDENDNLEFLSGLIFKLGFEVVTAGSGIEGLHGF